jgi:diaminohydroxyphosphoribosylaminopyrimidine deaminase/5-amino-6-(5-phosphoribosylamino)uracil reductase
MAAVAREIRVRDVSTDEEAMARAVELAVATRRATPPWPSVGCMLVDATGAVVGEGATGPFPTGPHAEVAALRAAGDRARGATAYVTLEPCDHHGNTPACSEALVEAGVTRVVAALEDPDARVAGRGFAKLRAAGIDVRVGPGAEAATESMAAYLHHRATGRPLLVAKIAQSLDSRVAAADGTSRWITGDEARADAHELRADSQAIVVGAGTALADLPSLTVRDVADAPSRPPLRVLLDARGRVPATGPLFDTTLAPTLVVTTAAAPTSMLDGWRAAGAEVAVVAADASGTGVDLGETLDLLGARGVLQALFEGGPTVIAAALTRRHVQRVVAFVAPTLLGTKGAPAFAFDGPGSIADAERFTLVDVRRLGVDVRLDYDLVRPDQKRVR